MKVYVIINWFYEGDSNLVGSFEGVCKNKEEARLKLKTDLGEEPDMVGEVIYWDPNKDGKGSFMPEDNWGHYNSPSKWEIRECEL